jgi:SAM-dependent methyltransferase
MLGPLHHTLVHRRRVRRLAEVLDSAIPPGASVLDVGAGDGLIDRLLLERRPDLRVRGVDVLVRPGTHIVVHPFDGRTIPLQDREVDVVMFVDVLHHADDPGHLLKEAARAAAVGVVIKDHFREGFLAERTLRLMDWIGNARFGVRLPYNYLSRAEWNAAWQNAGLRVDAMATRLRLYSWPASWAFERSLHFVARLTHIQSR